MEVRYVPKFRSVFDKADVHSVSGDPFEPVYAASYDDFGVLVLEQTGKRDVYKEIQSHKDSVDINVIIARYQSGDFDVLSRVQGFYDDCSDMPKTYQDVLNSVISCEDFFNSLPASDKEKFNNNFSEFMVSLGDPGFIKRFSHESSYDSVSDPDVDVKDDGNES